MYFLMNVSIQIFSILNVCFHQLLALRILENKLISLWKQIKWPYVNYRQFDIFLMWFWIFNRTLKDLLTYYLLQYRECFSLFLPLAQLPLTAIFSLSSSPALYCHSSSVSFSFPFPHGTTSVWECCTCPVEKDSDKLCNEKPGSSFTSLCLVSIYHPALAHRACAVS